MSRVAELIILCIFAVGPRLSWSQEESVQTGDLYRISPEFTLSVPQPLMVGAEIQSLKFEQFRGYLDTGYLQYPLSTAKIGVKEMTIEAGLRYRPWGISGFMFSLGLGYRRIGASADISTLVVGGSAIATRAYLSLNAFYFTPMIDYQLAISKKSELSFGLGFQIPVIVSSSMSFENSNTGENSSSSTLLSVDSFPYLDRIARLVLPRVTLLRWIWHLEP